MPYVGILVRNLGATSEEFVQKAEFECAQIYRLAGIRIAWMNSVSNVTWEGPDVVLRVVILPQAPLSRAMGAFGTALRDRQEVLIYHDRVVLASKLIEISVPQVLSVALVHEIGHLLLDSDEHTVSGVMLAAWDQRAWNTTRQGLLRFTPEECRRMSANLAEEGSVRHRARVSGK
jgi:hypothetical protein